MLYFGINPFFVKKLIFLHIASIVVNIKSILQISTYHLHEEVKGPPAKPEAYCVTPSKGFYSAQDAHIPSFN
ncbi:hypothetical protein NOC27_275 [Nitrosococcus oceani AFC27]|nr:hypothetical protein NOC27_275 [Nitrosococcus oceani AFC27]